eukprot:1055504-Alexandrium_andersonii.AAC.1
MGVGVSMAGPVELEQSTEDVDEEMFFPRGTMDQRSEEEEHVPSVRTAAPPEEAVDLARALFAAGATPGE